METLEEQLEWVQKTIAAIESGAQEYKIGNRSLTRTNISTLYGSESSLRAAIAWLDGDNILYANIGQL